MPEPSLSSNKHDNGVPIVVERINDLDRPLLSDARETLAHTADVDTDPTAVRDAFETIDFELLRETKEHLESVLRHVYDPVIRAKSRVVDAIELSISNIGLLIEPMFERRHPKEALSMQQATRFALKNYTTAELHKQRGAAQSAYYELSKLLGYTERVTDFQDRFSTPDISPSRATPVKQLATTFISRIKAAFGATTTTNTDSTTTRPSETTSGHADSLDSSDIIWADADTAGKQWVDARHVEPDVTDDTQTTAKN